MKDFELRLYFFSVDEISFYMRAILDSINAISLSTDSLMRGSAFLEIDTDIIIFVILVLI